MKVVLQRVNRASVSVEGEIVGEIGRGLLLLVGFGPGDSAEKLKPFAEKIINMRLFPEGEKNFHLSTKDTGADVLLVSQFTLFADTSKGRRPDFFGALAPEQAASLFEQFTACFQGLTSGRIATGRFGAYMQVSLENDGPVTLLLDA